MQEAFELGLGEPIGISAEHGEGMGELYAALLPFSLQSESDLDRPETNVPVEEPAAHAASVPGAAQPVQIAIIGRPNAGKSTLINRILGEERLLTGSEAGITRDSIFVSLEWNGTPVRIFDTAGMRKRAKVQDKLERLSVADGLRSVRFRGGCRGLAGCGRAVPAAGFAACGLGGERGTRRCRRGQQMGPCPQPEENYVFSWNGIRGIASAASSSSALVSVSARTGYGLNDLHDAISDAWKIWNVRLATAPLNRWLAEMIEAHPPPAPGGRRIRLRYIAQVNARPAGIRDHVLQAAKFAKNISALFGERNSRPNLV